MKTLIVYASKHGSTKKCAEEISTQLKGEVELVHLKKDKVQDLANYDQVIIGGSIYMGRIQKEVKNFCSSNIEGLLKKRIGLYICCMRDNEQAIEEMNTVFPKELLEVSITKDYFGGEFNFQEMNFFERFIVKMVSKVENLPLDPSGLTSNLKQDRINQFISCFNA